MLPGEGRWLYNCVRGWIHQGGLEIALEGGNQPQALPLMAPCRRAANDRSAAAAGSPLRYSI